ncbi:hypothetical protein [Phytoactinopolyspora mesophila]|uniref:Uncharacterized protein n=1 Tax=Phytoactinopolyspora mesophila TaxID=2650750 RepID=A0A7K3M8F2_9ACTN|nr:hypothetical protein [Phytoactinopolyspora mesophila]NDL59460.1 hypothetical protein [Phytoactinopolyspora mesophila]
MTGSGWWRRNRWGLVALPFVLTAALVASSYHVEDRWWLQRPRMAVSAEQGEWADFADSRYDRSGDVPIELRARLISLEEATQPFGRPGDDLDLPSGTQGVAVVLELVADPDVPLAGCRLSLVGADGTEYVYQHAAPSLGQVSSPCVPPESPGPALDLFESPDDPEGDPRPEQWSVEPVVVVPEDVTVVEVRLTWGPPRYLAFRVAS